MSQDLKICGIPSSRPTYALCESRKETTEKGIERIFEQIMAKNLPNLIEYMNIHVQEVHQFPSRIKPETHTEKHYNKIIKQNQGDSFKGAKEK